MSEYLSKKAVLEWLESEMSINKGHPDDIDIHWTLNRVSKKILSGAFDANGEVQRLRVALASLPDKIMDMKWTDTKELTFPLDNPTVEEQSEWLDEFIDRLDMHVRNIIDNEIEGLSTTTESTCKCGGTGGYNLKFGQLGEETFPCEVCSADFFKKTGLERVREYCPDHPDVKPETSSSHTWTQDGNTYFVSYVKYCPTCYRVISTSARL